MGKTYRKLSKQDKLNLKLRRQNKNKRRIVEEKVYEKQEKK